MTVERAGGLVFAAAGIVFAAAVGVGCSDVGDNSAAPDAAEIDATSEVGEDVSVPLADATLDGLPTGESQAPDGAAMPDASTADTGGGQTDARADTGSVEDSSTIPDAANGLDARPDVIDGSSAADAVAETGPAEAGVDSGPIDASGGADAMTDAGHGDGAADASGILAPCTTANPTQCVQCQGNDFAPNPTSLCTSTEAALVQHDIDRNLANAPGPAPVGGCYECLEQSGCLDDNQYADKGHECGDFADPTSQSQCASVLSCILGSSCAKAAVSGCYCGTAGVSTACQGNPAPGPINGACAATIAAGLGYGVDDGTDVTKNLTDIAKPAGMADQIFQCAQSNACGACLQ